LLAADRTVGLQALVDETIGDLVKRHRRPVPTKEMFAQSLEDGRCKPKAA
jgi:hypothetical protein